MYSSLLIPVLALVEDGDTTSSVVTATDWSSVISAITAQVSVSTVVAVLASIVAASIGLAFMWWGVRKAVRALMSAFKKGKVSV